MIYDKCMCKLALDQRNLSMPSTRKCFKAPSAVASKMTLQHRCPRRLGDLEGGSGRPPPPPPPTGSPVPALTPVLARASVRKFLVPAPRERRGAGEGEGKKEDVREETEKSSVTRKQQRKGGRRRGIRRYVEYSETEIEVRRREEGLNRGRREQGRTQRITRGLNQTRKNLANLHKIAKKDTINRKQVPSNWSECDNPVTTVPPPPPFLYLFFYACLSNFIIYLIFCCLHICFCSLCCCLSFAQI